MELLLEDEIVCKISLNITIVIFKGFYTLERPVWIHSQKSLRFP